MNKYTVVVGDLLHAEGRGTFGIVHKVTPAYVHYYAFGKADFNKAPFRVEKIFLYKNIDNGTCTHQLGKTKYRRIR
jgi:hypothetical protein